MFCPQGHGMSCYHCDNCYCKFGVDCLDYMGDFSCPKCGSEDVTRTAERLIGKYFREYDSVEQYEYKKECN